MRDFLYFFIYLIFYVMRKNLFLTLALAFASFAGATAQNWSLTMSAADGLPGEKTVISEKRMYSYTSEKITMDEPLEAMRVTFRESVGGNALNGFPFVCLSELTVFAADGVTPIHYTATSNADHNTLGGSTDGAGLAGLNDGNYTNYWHSCWAGDVAEYHYLELQFDQPVSEFIIHWASRPHNGQYDYYHNAPALVGLTPAGVEFVPYADWAFTAAEEEITSMDELLSAKYFVMKSNVPVEYDVYVNNHDSEKPFGTKTNEEVQVGPGPKYVNAGAVADEPAPGYAIQLIEAEGGYYLYFVTEGKFLSKNASDNAWNGANGGQGKTSKISDAAIVTIEEVDGRFEMSYMSEYNGEEVEIHMGATPSSGGFKNVDKQRYDFYKEGHPYCLNYAYIISFDWSLYAVEMNYPARYLSLPVKGAISEAKSIYTFMDSVAVEGYEEDYDNFVSVLAEAEETVAASGYTTIEEVFTAVEEINNAIGAYVYSKIQWYNDEYLPTLAEKYEDLLTPSTNPQEGFYTEEAFFLYIQTNLIDACDLLYNEAYDDPYAKLTQMKNFINSVQNNIDAFLASQITFVTLPSVYTTDQPDNVGLGTQVGNHYEWEQMIALQEGVSVKGIRLTFLETVNGNSGGGGLFKGFPMLALSGLEVLDGNGEKIALTSELVTTNSEETIEREAGNGIVSMLFDEDLNTYYHSAWGDGARYDSPQTYVYLDIKFPDGVELNTFTVKTIGRGDRVALAPSTVCVTEYGQAYDPAIFRENPYEVNGGTQITDASQLKDGGIYIISGNLRVKTQGAAPRYYSGETPYHTNIKAALNDPCVYMFKQTENGWNIISLSKAQYWALNKNVTETKNEETEEVTVNKSWSTGLTVYPANAAEIKVVKSNNLENTFVFYSDIEENNIDASWTWTNNNDTTDVVKVEKGTVNANKFVFMDWDGNLAGRVCTSVLPGDVTYGIEALSAHAKFEDFKNGDGYSAGDYLHFNKANGEGEWNIYEVSMNDPYYLWANGIGGTLADLGLVVGNDPGCISGDIAALEAAVNAVETVVTNEDKEGAQAAVEEFVANVYLAQQAERVEVMDGYWYAIESAYTEYYKQQNKVKAIYAGANGLNWTNAPAAYDKSAAEFVFQFQQYDAESNEDGYEIPEGDENNLFKIWSDYAGAYFGEGGGTTQVAYATDAWSAIVYVVKPIEANIYTIHAIGADPLHTAGHGNGAGSEGTIVNWTGGAGTASSWTIRFVDDAEETNSIADLVVKGEEVVSVAYFTPAGAAIPAPVNGINIVVTVYSNGVIETKKVLVK